MSKKYPGGFVTALSPVGYSVYFDGTGDYLSNTSTSSTTFGTGDFTIECWVYPTALPSSDYGFFIDTRPSSSNNGCSLWMTQTNGYLGFFDGPPVVIVNSTSAVPLNQWSHVALVRNGSDLRAYLNGVGVANRTTSSNYTGDDFYIGTARDNPGVTRNYTGYISNLRIVKGTAVYTANFTPPTQLLNIPGTSLLTCNSPAIVDQSSNNFTITPFGNVAVSTLTPFSVYNAYNPALGASTPGVWTLDQALQAQATGQWNMYDPYFNLTTLLLPGNGTNGAQNNTFLDSSTNNFTITRNGNTTQGTFSPFSQTGWSNYFDGTGDYLTVPTNTALNFGTGDFTVELWWYPGTFSGVDGHGFLGGSVDGAYDFVYRVSTGFNLGRINVAFDNTFAFTAVANTWYHVAYSRSGTSLRVFVNGAQIGSTATNSISYGSNGGAAIIGASTTVDRLTIGYISNLRLLKGTALYTANFTPPTAPLTAIANTSLLTCQSNRFVDNSTNAFAITVNGNTSVQAFSPFAKVGAYNTLAVGGSGYFDGTGDYLSVADSAGLNPETDEFVMEAWVYITALTGNNQGINGKGTAGTNGYSFYVTNGLVLSFIWNGTGGATITAGTLSLNTWNHVAVVRNSGVIRLYLNGVGAGSSTPCTTNITSTGIKYIGQARGGNPILGYMSNYRMIKGSRPAGYDATASSLPVPAAPLTIPSNTNVSLLLNFTNAGITDATSKNALETVGNAQVSTSVVKYGTGSMYFDGSGDYLKSNVGTSDLYTFGTSDFTIEMWLYLTNVSVAQVIFDTRPASTNGVYPDIYFNDSGSSINWYISSADRITSSSVSINTWYHVAVCRSGTSTKMFINGTQSGSTYTDTNNYLCAAQRPIIGVNATDSSSSPFYGYIDDLRVTKGYARYTANFVPPTSALQLQGAGSQITPLLPNATYFMGIVGGSNTTNETAASVAVDADQNLYVAGYESTTGELLKVSPTGQLLFQKALSLSGVSTGVVTSGSNVYISSSYPFGNVYGVASQINSSGTAQWSRILSSVNPEGYNGVAVNSTGTNIYWAGYTQITGARRALLACYDASGVLQFQVASTGGGTTNEFACVAVASNGNIYAGARVSTGSGSYSEVAILNSSGVVQAQYRINALTDINSIAVDSAFNIYVVGTGGYLTGLLVKLNNSGVVQWAKSFASYNTERLAVNEDYNSVFLSTYDNTGAVIAKVDLSGTVLWQRRLTPSTGALYPYALTIDTQQGNVYLGAALQATYSDMFFAKLPPDGSLTGTYNVGGVSVTYGTVSVVSSTSVSATAGSISISTSALTASSSSVSTSNSSFSSSIILL